MSVFKWLKCLAVLAAVSLSTTAVAGTLGSSGEGLWTLQATFDAPDGVETITVPANGMLGNILRLDSGHLLFEGGLQSSVPDQSTVQALGGFSHFTQPSPFDANNDSHFGIFTQGPLGTFVDNGALAIGNGVIEFRLDFELGFFVDGTGIGAVPLSLNLPIAGTAPPGYRINYEFEATWTDTTTGIPAAAAVVLTDTEQLNAFGMIAPVSGPVVLTDTDAFGPITGPAFGDHFSVDGFLKITVDKENGAAVPGPPPVNFFELGMIPGVGDQGDGFFRFQFVPEPGSTALLLVGVIALVPWHRRD